MEQSVGVRPFLAGGWGDGGVACGLGSCQEVESPKETSSVSVEFEKGCSKIE